MSDSRQEYWSGLLFPSPGDLANPGIEHRSPTLQADSLLSEPLCSKNLNTTKNEVMQLPLPPTWSWRWWCVQQRAAEATRGSGTTCSLQGLRHPRQWPGSGAPSSSWAGGREGGTGVRGAFLQGVSLSGGLTSLSSRMHEDFWVPHRGGPCPAVGPAGMQWARILALHMLTRYEQYNPQRQDHICVPWITDKTSPASSPT